MRAAANGDTVGIFELALEDHELGLAVPAVETGTLNRSASILIQAGFNSRLAAIKAMTDTGATFTTGRELRQWLGSEVVAAWSVLPDWPTLETKPVWMEFAQSFIPTERRTWADRRYWANVASLRAPLPPGTAVQVHTWAGQPHLLSMDGTPLGTVQATLNPRRAGLLRAKVAQDVSKIDLTYLGPDDLGRA